MLSGHNPIAASSAFSGRDELIVAIEDRRPSCS